MRFALLFLLMLGFRFIHAGEFENLHFTHINKDHGLSDNNVEVIFKDSDGFIWFGTRNGLCRFDGYTFTVFKKTEGENSISGNRILDIAEDDEGFIWIGTYKNGLNKLSKYTGHFTHYGRESGIGERINRIKKFTDGSIWICSNRGLANYKAVNDSFNVYLSNEGQNQSIHSDLVHDIFETSSGDIYVAPEFAGLQKFNRKKETFTDVFYARDNLLGTNYRKKIIEDKNGVLWIAAHNHGLCSYNPKTNKSEIFTTRNSDLSTDVLMGNMALDVKGNIWLCTEEDGINIFNIEKKQFSFLRHQIDQKESLSTNHTYSIYIDNDQLVWIGTFDKGLNVYNPHQEKFNASLFSADDLKVLRGHSVLDVFEDTQNRVWFGTDGNGLYKFEKGEKPVLIKEKERGSTTLLSSNIITAIGQDSEGNILLGTYTGGLVSFDVDKNQSKIYLPDYSGPGNLTSTNVWEIFSDSRKRTWLGLLGTGVDEFLPNAGKFNNYGPFTQAAYKIDFPNVMVITEDSDGDIWFGTEGRGLFILDHQTQKVYQIPNDTTYKIATEGIVKCLLQDRWGFMWIGTEDNGLFKFDKKTNTFEKIIFDKSRPTDPVLSIQEDNIGNIWMGTSRGLFQLNTNTRKINRFETADGLSSNDFNADAMIKLEDGRILAGTKNGADIIEPDRTHLNQTLPKVIFTKLTVLNNEVFPNKEINGRIILSKNIVFTKAFELTWKEKIFTIEFAALNYTLPKKCQYKYMLEGFDEKWVQTDANRRFASYSNLAPGDYTFKVMASNNDGKWGNNQTSIQIKVKPPFYQTWVFKIVASLLLLFIAIVLYRRRINIHKERFRQKQLQQERKIMELEKEMMESELKKLAFNILNKNKLLIEQKNRIQSLSNKAKVSVKEGLQKIVESIDADLDDEKDWKFIEPQIDKAYNQFILKLKQEHPDLTATEIRLAAYIRMNLTTKEICEFMNKTQRAIENDRYRLRKKIGLESNDSIQSYFLNL